MFFNLLGLSTIGGDVVRALYLSDGERRGVALDSVVFDRASGLAVLMALGAAALVAFPGYDLPRLLTVVLIAGGLTLFALWLTCPLLVRILPRTNWLRRQVEIDLAPFWAEPRFLVLVAGVSLSFHLVQTVAQYFLARAAGVAVPFSYCLIYHPVISVVAALPVTIAGFGMREGTYLYFLSRIGVSEPIAVSIGLLWFTITLLSGLVGGILFLAGGARLPRLIRPNTIPRSSAEDDTIRFAAPAEPQNAAGPS
jgi:uncharacterized membrane protein YbhN (UPF0104 family)